jgi:endogenous inhibitor of DNA gyrase (YacG/DUF329 family)
MKCPTCGKPVQWQDDLFRPFCSERCKLIDLGCWVNEEYTVPGERVNIPDEPLPAEWPLSSGHSPGEE